jgi:simple sugar transport system permease protein
MMLPYILTITVLVMISVLKGRGRFLGSPSALGLPFYREERE